MESQNRKQSSEKSNAQVARKGAGKATKAKKQSKIKVINDFREKWYALDKKKKAIVIAVLAVVIVLLFSFIAVWGFYSGFRTNINEKNLGISDDIYNYFGDTDVVNIAVFGLDTRDENSFKGRSDSIIIVSINPKDKTVKLTSILRDSYVAIEGYKNQKITHAYSFGGAELAIKTLNQNFHLNISDYATINFYKLADAIDVLGGIDITITESEMKQINDIGDDEGKIIEQVTEYGDVHLNGDQAAVFVRLRKHDSDVARSNRQKMVINALLTKARQVSPAKYGEVVKSIMSLCETSLSFSEVMALVPLINEDVNIQTLTIPNEEEAIGGVYEGAWVWRYDLDKASQKILEFIYGEAPTFSYNSNDLFTRVNEENTKNNYNYDDEDDEYPGVTIIGGKYEETTRQEYTTQADVPETTTQQAVTEPQTQAVENTTAVETTVQSTTVETTQAPQPQSTAPAVTPEPTDAPVQANAAA